MAHPTSRSVPSGSKDSMSLTWELRVRATEIAATYLMATGNDCVALTNDILKLLKTAQWEAYKNIHDCRIRVSEEHIGLEMTPDVYALNNLRRLAEGTDMALKDYETPQQQVKSVRVGDPNNKKQGDEL